MGGEKPLWKELGAMSEKKQGQRKVTHQNILESFKGATKLHLDRIRKIEREIEERERDVIANLEGDDTASALGLMLGLRRFRIDLLVERSALSIVRANRCYNQTILSIINGVAVGVKYDSESVRKLIPKEMKEAVDTSIKATDFNEVLRRYRKQIEDFLIGDDDDDDDDDDVSTGVVQ